MDHVVNYLEQIPPEILYIILIMVTRRINNITAVRCLSNTFNTIFEKHIKPHAFDVVLSKQLERYLKSGSTTLHGTVIVLELCKTCNDNDLIKFTKLRCVNSDFGNISDKSIRYMTKLSQLEIDSHSNITDISIKKLLRLRKLSIDFNKTITDNSIKLLTKLRWLSINSNKVITNHGISVLTNLKYLSLSGDQNITDNGLQYLTNLESLSLKRNKNISNDALKHLKLKSITLSDDSLCKLTPDMTYLSSLYLSGCRDITDDQLGKMTNLRLLSISDMPKITINSLSLLTNLTALWSFSNLLNKTIIQQSIPKLTTIKIF